MKPLSASKCIAGRDWFTIDYTAPGGIAQAGPQVSQEAQRFLERCRTRKEAGQIVEVVDIEQLANELELCRHQLLKSLDELAAIARLHTGQGTFELAGDAAVEPHSPLSVLSEAA